MGQTVARLGELRPGESKKFLLDVAGHEVEGFVVNFAGTHHAYVNRCRHVPMGLDWVENQFFTEDGQFIQWLAKIVEHNICDLRRRIEPRKQGLAQMREPLSSSSGAGLALPATGPSPSDIARGTELAQALDQAMARLNPTYRKIILLRDMRDMTYEEIAKELRYKHAKTARVKLSVARRRLRELMEPLAPSGLRRSSTRV